MLETPVSQWALETARNGRRTLEAGVTFVRDLAGAPLDRNCLVDRISKESLTAVARQLVFVDLPIPPFLHRTHDRGYAMERAWERDTGVLSQCFVDLKEGERAGWRPSLIVSPVIVGLAERALALTIDAVKQKLAAGSPPPDLDVLQLRAGGRLIAP